MFVVTFYSFKGGVGRTMALANCAELLAQQGHKVLVIDWDLEAPGLERYVMATQESSAALWAKPGVIDLVREMRAYADAPRQKKLPPVAEFIHELRRPGMDPGSLSIMTAGRRDGDYRKSYSTQVQEFDWRQFYERFSGGALLDKMLDDIEQQGFDFVLIDSRTGVTEQGGICTHHLADCVILVTGTNDVNLEASAWMNDAFHEAEVIESRGGRPLPVLPVASRVEKSAEKEAYTAFLQEFSRRFSGLLPDCVRQNKHLEATQIPYIPFYAMEERVAAREPDSEVHPEMLGAYNALVKSIKQVRSAAQPDAIERRGAESGRKLSKEELQMVQTIDRHARAWRTILCRDYFVPAKLVKWQRLSTFLEFPESRRLANWAYTFSVLVWPMTIGLFLAIVVLVDGWADYEDSRKVTEAALEDARRTLQLEVDVQAEAERRAQEAQKAMEKEIELQNESLSEAKESLAEADNILKESERALSEAEEQAQTTKEERQRLLNHLEDARNLQRQRQAALDATRQALEASRAAEEARRVQLEDARRREQELRRLHENVVAQGEAQTAQLLEQLRSAQVLVRDLRARVDEMERQKVQLVDLLNQSQVRLESDAKNARSAADAASRAVEKSAPPSKGGMQ